ncbi:Cro protein [Mycobacterium phage Spikelee]|nr:transcriptional repressor [Mycobacterium phage Bipolar]YP_009962505.1 transcriptional repressor [Mycobacterium phage Spikelee]AIT13080.1 HTH domain protein [Mycobacterium phage Bipolar]AXQ62181.1 Cro protein [Mycobacterium phage Spikelee]QIQ63729.1 Cro protein [Mycobacterium phage Phanphagia]
MFGVAGQQPVANQKTHSLETAMTRGFAIKMGRVKREMKKRGIPDYAALARDMKVNKSTVWRVMNGRARPGPDFVNALLDAWDLEFHDLFDDPRKLRPKKAA